MTSLPSDVLRLLASAPLNSDEMPETAADRAAALHWGRNLAALSQWQGQLARRLEAVPTPMRWTFGRDGYPTAFDDVAGWYGACSVPLAAARQMLGNLELDGAVGCFLHPTHAGQLRAAFEKIAPTQVILAVIPDLTDLAVMLRCDDFSSEIAAKRLWFAAGWDWAQALAELFKTHGGLPIPQQFIRTPLLDDALSKSMIPEAQEVFSKETARRAGRLGVLRWQARPAAPSGRICVVAPSGFKLWNLAGPALRAALDGGEDFLFLDSDDPLCASPLELATTAAPCDAIVSADFGRADLPGILSPEIPWISWITLARIPPFDPSAPRDAILLADPAWRPLAQQAGWPGQRISLAGWPPLLPPPQSTGSLLGLIVDTVPIEKPKKLADFSSHVLLWEQIQGELARQPLAVGSDPHEYLSRHIKHLGIAPHEVNESMFVRRLIEPAYHQGLAKAMLQAKLPLALVGRGWTDIAGLADHAAGPVASMAELSDAVASCRALFCPALANHRHPIETLGLPVLRPSGGRMESLIQQARAALANGTCPPVPAQPLSRQCIHQFAVARA